MKKFLTKEVKIAAAAVVAVVLLFFGMNFLKGLTVFSNSSTYYMTFTDAKGLSKSTAVYADGYKVGSVMDIVYDYAKSGNIIVEVDLDPSLRIPAGSKAMIESDLMGNIKVNLLLATNPRERIEEGGTIEGVEENGVMNQLQSVVPVVVNMVPKLDSIVASLNALLSNPAIVNMLVNAETMSANLATTTAELNTMMSNINRSMPEMMQHANGTLANTETMTQRLSTIDVEGMMAKVNHTLENVETMTNALNNREGSLGLLMYDKELYNNLTATMGDADSLMIDLKAHPKRYVHFSIFGKKDK